jgi:hypothetical protein
MRYGKLFVVFVALMFIVLWSIQADAGEKSRRFPAPIPQTGQTDIYSPSDDGDLQRGVPWPDPRFTDYGDGTVRDNLTGLIWLKNANCPGDNRLTWQGALDFVADINRRVNDCGDISKAGDNQTDWRLPNIRELTSLVDYSQVNPALPFGHPFTNFSGRMLYWSSTTDANNPALAFVVDFVFGNVGNGFAKTGSDGNYGFVIAVRGGN